MTRKARILWCILLVVVLVGAALAWLVYVRLPPDPQMPGRLLKGELQWDGHRRTYTYYLPSNPTASPPLLLVFHGSAGDAWQSRAMFGYAFEVLAEEQGFIVAYPEGFERHFNGCRRAGPYTANEQNIDDVGFMRALTARMVEEHGVNPASVYATGLSNGGQMALRLALEAPDLVRAVAPVATSMPAPDNMDCEMSGEPVAFLLMNGTADPMNPFEGGTVALYGLFGNRGEVLSSRATVDYFAQLAGYRGEPREFHLPDKVPEDDSTVTLSLWAGSGRIPVALYTIHGGGHGAPNPKIIMPRLLGGSNRDIIAAQHIWNFFRGARPRPQAQAKAQD